MCYSDVVRFVGRTANNWIQLLNCLYYSFNLKRFHKIVFPPHQFLSIREIKNPECGKACRCDKKKTDSSYFFFNNKLGFKPTLKILKDLHQQYLASYVVNIDLNKPSLNPNELLIHIRSGDIFCSNPHLSYYPPPLDYYHRLIKGHGHHPIHFVYENEQNPCIKKLKEDYPGINCHSRSLKEDIELLCRAQTLAIGFGSFGLLIFLLSKNLKNLYAPSYQMEQNILYNFDYSDVGSVNLTKIDLAPYIQQMGRRWSNSPEQRELMMSYKIGSIPKGESEAPKLHTGKELVVRRNSPIAIKKSAIQMAPIIKAKPVQKNLIIVNNIIKSQNSRGPITIKVPNHLKK
jgi:hypothetical protein